MLLKLILQYLTVSPSDYEAVNSMVLSFDTCETRSCINVYIIDDTISEEDETFKISLTRTPTLDSRINLDPVSGEVIITETNGITFLSCHYYC